MWSSPLEPGTTPSACREKPCDRHLWRARRLVDNQRNWATKGVHIPRKLQGAMKTKNKFRSLKDSQLYCKLQQIIEILNKTEEAVATPPPSYNPGIPPTLQNLVCAIDGHQPKPRHTNITGQLQWSQSPAPMDANNKLTNMFLKAGPITSLLSIFRHCSTKAGSLNISCIFLLKKRLSWLVWSWASFARLVLWN